MASVVTPVKSVLSNYIRFCFYFTFSGTRSATTKGTTRIRLGYFGVAMKTTRLRKHGVQSMKTMPMKRCGKVKYAPMKACNMPLRRGVHQIGYPTLLKYGERRCTRFLQKSGAFPKFGGRRCCKCGSEYSRWRCTNYACQFKLANPKDAYTPKWHFKS